MKLIKAFDRINSVADTSFLAACRCKGDSCSCKDFYSGTPLFVSAAQTPESASASDPQKKQAFADAIKGLSSLGFAIDQVAATGNWRELDKAMKESRWSPHQRILLKRNLSAVGAI